jgi:exodeoxyribonuclease VII large subunit
MRRILERRRAALEQSVARMESLSPLRVLERGYSLTTAGGHVVTDAAQLAPGQVVELRFVRGRVRASVMDVD